MAVASSSPGQSVDPWDQQYSPSTSRRSTKPAPVREDWEDDDVEEIETEKDNQRIWDAANAKAPNPMPAVIAMSPHQVLTPPPGAFQPTLRILKRPSESNSKSPTPPPSSSSSDTLKDREARYQAARERIFGDELLEGNGSTASLPVKERTAMNRSQDVPNVLVSRSPRGPADNPSNPQGFGRQRATPPSTSDHVQEDS